MVNWLIRLVAFCRKSVDQNPIIFWPPFDRQEDLTDFYFRAAFYHHPLPGEHRRTILPVTSNALRPGQAPDFMTRSSFDASSIILISDEKQARAALLSSRTILQWRRSEAADATLMPFRGKTFDVSLNAPAAKEWGVHGQLSWVLLWSIERRLILMRERLLFRHRAYKYKSPNQRAVIIGNAPSRDAALADDLSDALVIICNSAVSDTVFNQHANPTFVTAGDAISHWGVSNYAAKFRQDLTRFLKTNDVFLLSSASLAYRFKQQNPDLAHKIFLCPQRGEDANLNLFKEWRLPTMDSTLNIHMIPLAASLADEIEFYGFDGKNPDESKNEDFWAHAQKSHYSDLVEDGHLAHPAFRAMREATTYEKYTRSVAHSLDRLQSHNKIVRLKTPSFISALQRYYQKPPQD